MAPPVPACHPSTMSGRRAGDREVIPLFPLSTVLVPGLLLPLNVFEPRYRQLVDELMDKEPDEQFFGVVAIREGREVGVGRCSGAVRGGDHGGGCGRSGARWTVAPSC